MASNCTSSCSTDYTEEQRVEDPGISTSTAAEPREESATAVAVAVVRLWTGQDLELEASLSCPWQKHCAVLSSIDRGRKLLLASTPPLQRLS